MLGLWVLERVLNESLSVLAGTSVELSRSLEFRCQPAKMSHFALGCNWVVIQSVCAWHLNIYALKNIPVFPVTLSTPGWLKRGHRGGEKWAKLVGKVKVKNEEAKLKCLIILRAASPCEYTPYLLTISPSLFCCARLIAPFNLCVCEMRGLGRAPTRLRGCALLACYRASGREIKKIKGGD